MGNRRSFNVSKLFGVREVIQLIVDRQELTNISKEAKEWFYDLVLNGEDGPFTCETFNDESKVITLSIGEDHQESLF